MEMQNQIKEYVAQYEKEVRKLADQLRNESMPQPTEELFSEFETNGNRMRLFTLEEENSYQCLVLQV